MEYYLILFYLWDCAVIFDVYNISHDFGADIIAKKNNEKICIQAKRYNKNINIGIGAVQERVIGLINYYKANKEIVITISNFTKSEFNCPQK